ncbi:MAG: class I SAM-dependent methyltransferase [Deltaproteobacteria bacterium]|jgi:23S rRNA (cytosine1962-C5)-methyltransferase|nr:class I SAM-dependent methyltransferase [Deltaproteobacteria bacterium]
MDLHAAQFDGYELLGCGDERKLERLAGVVVERPASQAIWPLPERLREIEPQVVFRRRGDGSGSWKGGARAPAEGWTVSYGGISFEIRLTGHGNLGLFPEHSCHFEWLEGLLARRPSSRVLNLFAYTGGASMVCARAGAQVTHVDAARAVNGWARRNIEISGLPDDRVRFLADDALKLVKRELRRGNRYEGIILDPPSFGRGPKGEVWKLERDLATLVARCRELLADHPLFFLLTAHSPGVTAAVLRGAVEGLPGPGIESGEMLIAGDASVLPSGAYARWAATNG